MGTELEGAMWIVAGVLLGAVVLFALAGLHVGPHSHGLAALIGVVAAAWLIAMVARGTTTPVVFALLGADLALSGGLGALARKAIADSSRPGHHLRQPVGSIGVVVSDLDPVGVVRVRGEDWSAESLSGRLPAGAKVQVVGREGVRLQVWAEDAVPLPGAPLEIGGTDLTETASPVNRPEGLVEPRSSSGGDESEAAER